MAKKDAKAKESDSESAGEGVPRLAAEQEARGQAKSQSERGTASVTRDEIVARLDERHRTFFQDMGSVRERVSRAPLFPTAQSDSPPIPICRVPAVWRERPDPICLSEETGRKSSNDQGGQHRPAPLLTLTQPFWHRRHPIQI